MVQKPITGGKPVTASNESFLTNMEKTKIPSKTVSFYSCTGTTYLDTEEFELNGKPICFGLERKLHSSIENTGNDRKKQQQQQRNADKMVPSIFLKTKEEERTSVASLYHFKQMVARVLGTSEQELTNRYREQKQHQRQHQYPKLKELSNLDDQMLKKKKRKKHGKFTFQSYGYTQYAVLENIEPTENIQDIKNKSSYNNRLFLTNNSITHFNPNKPILAAAPSCKPGISIKTIENIEKQYNLDLGFFSILGVDVADTRKGIYEEEDEDDMNTTLDGIRNIQSSSIKSNKDIKDAEKKNSSETLHNIEELTVAQKREQRMKALNEERERKRKEFLKQREQIFREFERERKRFFPNLRTKNSNNRSIDKIDGDWNNNNRDDAVQPPLQPHPYPFPKPQVRDGKKPPIQEMDSEQKRLEREEALKAFWIQIKKEKDGMIDFGGKTFQIMKALLTGLVAELQDDFPNRVLESSKRIVGQFGHTVEQCQHTAGAIYRFWMDNDDDDDEDEYDGYDD